MKVIFLFLIALLSNLSFASTLQSSSEVIFKEDTLKVSLTGEAAKFMFKHALEKNGSFQVNTTFYFEEKIVKYSHFICNEKILLNWFPNDVPRISYTCSTLITEDQI